MSIIHAKSLSFFILAIIVFAQSAQAQTILLDDFSNPDLAGWFNTETYSEKPWGPGILEVRDGELFYGTMGSIPVGSESGLNNTGFALSQWNASTVDPIFNNGTLRAKVRAKAPDDSSEAGNIAMYVRGDLATLTAYVLAAIGSNKTIELDKFVNGVVEEAWVVEDVDFTLNEDWYMELGAVGSELSVKMWKASDEEPFDPQLSVIDTELFAGSIGLTAGMTPHWATEPIALNTYYDDVTFTVPEPCSSIALLLGGVALLLACRRSNQTKACFHCASSRALRR